MILIIGLADDLHLNIVAQELANIGELYFRFDPSDDDGIPLLRKLGSDSGTLAWPDGRILELSKVQSVFCRYAVDGIIVSQDLPDIERYGCEEKLKAFLSALRTIPLSDWINDPWMESRADCKIYQTALAARLGLRTPKQIVTDLIADAAASFGYDSDCIIKPISDASFGRVGNDFYCDKPIPNEDFSAPFTSRINLRDAPQERNLYPFLIQECVERKYDVRVYVIDNHIYSYSITLEGETSVDLRLNRITGSLPYNLDASTKEKLLNLRRKMGVRFMACDFIENIDGDLVFLEANVSGNWLFTDIDQKFEISKTISFILSGKNI
jgi:hypothetical protein